jgi:hypothetical protein
MKLLSVFLLTVVVVSLFYIFSSSVFAQGGESLFTLEDVGSTQDSNLTVTICANNGTSISGFNFWYNETGPLNATNQGIINATFYNDTVYDDSEFVGFNNASGAGSTPQWFQGCVKFILDNTSAAWNIGRVMINATVYNNTIYLQTNAANRSMFTINYVIVQTKDVSGSNSIPNVIIMDFDNVTKSFISNGPALSAPDGYWAEHCMGVVSDSNCVSEVLGGRPNVCKTHGIGFPDSGSVDCQINSTTTIHAFDFISSNFSQQNVTPGTLLIINLTAPAAPTMIMSFDWNPDNMQGQMELLSVSQVNVSDYYTDQLLFSLLSGGGGPGSSPPMFIQAYRLYKITFTFNNIAYTYPFMTPSAGMGNAQIFIANSTVFSPSSGYRTVVGKVVNESGNAMAGAVVYAQFFKGPSASGISFFNSSVADANGIFSMRIPKTRTPSENQQENMYFPVYQFYIISNQTNSSNQVPIYFPTIDNNDNRGYFALGDTVVLPSLILKRGGQVNVNVTLNNARLVMSELSKFLTLGTGVIRDAVTGKFTMTSIFEDVSPPTSIITSLLSPVGTAVLNLFGKNVSMGDPMSGSIINVCNASATVEQGLASSVNCNLTQPGYLNLTVLTCDNIFNTSSGCSMQMQAGRFDFWFETNGILRDSTGQIVNYFNPEGVLLENLLGFGGNPSDNITIPLPPGTYTLELMPMFEHSQFLRVYNGTSFVITSGQTNNTRMVRGQAWNIQPMFNPSLIFSENNPINVSVMGMNGMLNNSYVTLNDSKILYLNKSDASPGKTIIFGYDSQWMGGVFYNTTFNASAFGLTAGKYWILLNATNQTGNDVFTTTFLMPIHAYDFQVGLDLGGFTFGTGQNISGKIFAFNSTGPVDSNTSAVVVEMFDQNGNRVNTPISPSSISNGIGSVNITVPSTQGFYEIAVTVNASNKYGVASNWLQASNLNIKITTDKRNYKPTDNVILTVQVSNATNGSAIQGASVEAVVDNSNTPALGVTGTDGKAAVTLNSSTHGGSSSWSFGWHNIRIKISKQTASDVINLDTWFGFDIRGMDMFIRPNKPVYSQGDEVVLDVFGPSGFTILSSLKVDGTTLTENMTVGNCVVTPGTNFCMSDVDNFHKQISLGAWSLGHHDVQITASFGGDQTFYTGFDVNSYNIMLSTNKFSYDLNEWINLSVKVMAVNGSALPNMPVVATLYKAQPPNDINVTQNTTMTDAAGKNSTLLNASQPGFNYIKVNVSGQLQFIGLQVSSVKVSLLDSTGSVATNYNAAPGDNVAIYVNATSGGSNVPDGSAVKATLWAFGNSVELPSNTTTSGNATIFLSIPTFAPAQVYGLEVRMVTPTGDMGFAAQSTLTVTGGSALQLKVSADRSFIEQYKPGDTAVFTAVLTYPNGTGVGGYNVTFEVGSEATRPQTKGYVATDSSGTATLISTAPTADGPYFLHAYLTSSPDVQAYSGFLVSSMRTNVTTDKSVYSPGENISLIITVTDRTTGSLASATGGFIMMFNKEKGKIERSVDTSGSQPYIVNLTIPSESSAVGSYPIGVVMFVNQSQGVGFKLIEVRNATQSLNLTLPSDITAGSYFLVVINASTGTSAALRIFSPAVERVVYENTSVTLSGSPPSASINMTITNPGVYVFNTFVPGIGGESKIFYVAQPTTGATQVWTGSSTSVSATRFTTAQDVYLISNLGNTTANVLTVSNGVTTSISLPLTLNTTSTYYAVLNHTNLVSGNVYFIRLDTANAAGVATAMFSVS